MMTQQCRICLDVKDISLFPYRKDSGKHRTECKDCCRKRSRQWKRENDFDRKQYQKHREKKLASAQAYRRNPENKMKIRSNQNSWRKKQMKNNPSYKIAHNLRRRCLLALHGKYKHDTTFKLVGCSAEELKKHLESLWQDGMNWENYGIGGWHVDHKIPISSFDLTKEEEQRKAFHFSNLQPLWEKDNLIKGAKTL